MADEWDGSERRRPERLAAELQQKRSTVEIRVMPFVAGFVLVGLLQAGLFWGLIVHGDQQRREGLRADRFRDQLTCFVVKISRADGQPVGPDILTDCGFITTSGGAE